MNKKKTVALIYGGRGYESEVSLRGAENIRHIIEKNYRCLSIFIDKDGRWLFDGKEVLLKKGGIIVEGEYVGIDCAFPLLHGDFGEDGRVQGALDCASIRYVGSDAPVCGICRDKYVVKSVARSLGIPTLPCVLGQKRDGTEQIIAESERAIGYPAFIKPTSLGSSIGASSARNRGELISSIQKAFSVCEKLIIEPCLIRKRELECGYFSTKCKDIFTKCGEILCDGFYSYDKKYSSPDTKILPVAEVGEEINAKIKGYSKNLVRALGIKGLARIDYFLSDGMIYFNEINLIPGMTKTSLYQKMIESAGIPKGEFVNLLTQDCLCRE